MAQYLMALLGQRDPSVFARGMGDNPAANGRMGDYVFNQEGSMVSLVQAMVSKS